MIKKQQITTDFVVVVSWLESVTIITQSHRFGNCGGDLDNYQSVQNGGKEPFPLLVSSGCGCGS